MIDGTWLSGVEQSKCAFYHRSLLRRIVWFAEQTTQEERAEENAWKLEPFKSPTAIDAQEHGDG